MDNSVRTDSRVPVLDLLRLAAVVAVILYHYGFWGPTSTNGVSQVAIPALAPIGQYGFLGVSVFFAISGFVIAYSAEGRNWIGFIIARFSRIYPTFVLCMTLTFAVTLAAGAGHFDVTRTQWFANFFIAAPFLGQPYVDTVYWSLVIEVVFYGWVALFMMLGWFPRRMDAIILAWLAITFNPCNGDGGLSGNTQVGAARRASGQHVRPQGCGCHLRHVSLRGVPGDPYQARLASCRRRACGRWDDLSTLSIAHANGLRDFRGDGTARSRRNGRYDHRRRHRHAGLGHLAVRGAGDASVCQIQADRTCG
jgi:hypothetical protein